MSVDPSLSNSESVDAEPEISDTPDGDKQTQAEIEKAAQTQAEIAKAARRRDDAIREKKAAVEREQAVTAQLVEAKKQLEEFEKLKRQLEDDEAVKKGDIQKLRQSAQEQADALKAQLSAQRAEADKELAAAKAEAEELRNTYLLKNEVMTVLHKICPDGRAPAAWLHVKELVELGPDMRPQAKESTLELEAYIRKHFEENKLDFFLDNPRAKGTGAPAQQGGNSAPAKTITPADIDAMPDRGKKYFAENPEFAREFLERLQKSGR